MNIGMRVPDRKDKYVLTKCLSCGSILPAMKKNLVLCPPRRCVFCSNIGNHSGVQTSTNAWTLYDTYAVCNVMFHGSIVSFYVDSSDYDMARAYVWRISQKRQKYYVVSGSNKKGTMIYLHTLILGGCPNGMEVDHIDGNSLNNRRSNLRIVSRQQNVDNQRATRIDNQIGIRGIAYAKREKKYRVDFNYHGKRFYTRSWDTLEQAVWCRRCFEEYFDIPAIKNNPLAEQYYTLDDESKKEIEAYVLGKILGNER